MQGATCLSKKPNNVSYKFDDMDPRLKIVLSSISNIHTPDVNDTCKQRFLLKNV